MSRKTQRTVHVSHDCAAGTCPDAPHRHERLPVWVYLGVGRGLTPEQREWMFRNEIEVCCRERWGPGRLAGSGGEYEWVPD